MYEARDDSFHATTMDRSIKEGCADDVQAMTQDV